MKVALNHDTVVPIYRQIVDRLRQDIEGGALPPQTKLPTVRDFARLNGISKGTVKHAYDTLEKQGLIKKVQGSGSFVCFPDTPGQQARAEGMRALDAWMDDMQERAFSLIDIRLMMEERFRARTHLDYTVRVAAVDCTPEAQAVMHRQFIRIPHVEVSDYLLDPVLESSHIFDPDVDIIVTTPTHYEELLAKTSPKRHIIQLVLAMATGTALELAAIPRDAKVGILCITPRFGSIIRAACDEYATLDSPPKVACAEDFDKAIELAQNCDQLILAPNFHLFMSGRDLVPLQQQRQRYRPITYQYQIEKGSLLFLEEQVSQIHEDLKRRGAAGEL